MMFADEKGTFDRSVYSLSAFALRNYWLDDQKYPAVYIPNGFAVKSDFSPFEPSYADRSCSGKMTIEMASYRNHFFNFIGSLRRNRSEMIRVLRSNYPVGNDEHSRYLIKVRPDFGGPHQTYLSNLEQSAFTLCPCGNNPETHRLWEALHSGSIPLVERCSGPGAHNWYSHLLKHMPHLIVFDSWHSLPHILNQYEFNNASMDQRQRHVYVEFHQYMKFVGRIVAQTASRSWNISMRSVSSEA